MDSSSLSLRKRFVIMSALALTSVGCAATSTDFVVREDAWLMGAPETTELAGASAPGGALADGATLRDLLALALARNPRIHAARQKALASAEAGTVQGALPDPKLLLGWYAESVQTRVGPQEYSLGLQQAVPFPSKLRLRKELGDTLAARDRVAWERTIRDVLAEVVRAAHELRYIDAAVAISADIAPLLERYTAAAAGNDQDPLSNLFRAETQRAQLENDRVILAELRAVEVERLLALLDLPTDTAFGTPRAPAALTITANYDDLLKIARKHNQEVVEAGFDVQAAAIQSELARKSRWPDFTVGYMHVFTERLSPSVGNPAGNGDDAQILQFGMTLPVWANKNAAAIRRAQAMQRVAVQSRRGKALRVRTQLARAWFDVGNAKRLVDLYHTVLVPRAELAARTAEDLHASGKGSLNGTIETIAVLHNFRLAAARARADYGQAVATLESVLGRPLAVLKGGVR